MIKRLLVIIFTGILLSTQAQESENELLSRFSLGGHIGTSQYMGDLGVELFDFSSLNLSYGGHINYKLNTSFDIHVLFLATKLDYNNFRTTGFGRDFTAKTILPQALLRYNFNNGSLLADDHPFRLSIQTGLSFQRSSVVFNKLKADPLKNEINQSVNSNSMNIPLGVVVGYRFAEHWRVDLNLNGMYALSDEVDGYFAGEFNDVIFLPTLSIQFNLGGINTSNERKPTELEEPEPEKPEADDEAMPVNNDGDPDFLKDTVPTPEPEPIEEPVADTAVVDTVVAPKPELTGEITYRIQLGAFSKPVNPIIYQSAGEIDVIESNGLYRVYVGNYTDKNEAIAKRQELLDKGFSGAFVATFVNGQRK